MSRGSRGDQSIQHPADRAVVHPGSPYPSLCLGDRDGTLAVVSTRPARRPAPYASDTLPGVTPPSGPRLISVCIQPSPWARRSVGVVERDGSRFLRPDPPPWWGRQGSGMFSTSRECPPSVTPTPYPRPFRPLFHAALVAVAPLVLGKATPPWSGTWLLWCPRPYFSSASISLNVRSPVVCRMRPPDLACSCA